jgi:hypothetical protein
MINEYGTRMGWAKDGQREEDTIRRDGWKSPGGVKIMFLFYFIFVFKGE